MCRRALNRFDAITVIISFFHTKQSFHQIRIFNQIDTQCSTSGSQPPALKRRLVHVLVTSDRATKKTAIACNWPTQPASEREKKEFCFTSKIPKQNSFDWESYLRLTIVPAIEYVINNTVWSEISALYKHTHKKNIICNSNLTGCKDKNHVYGNITSHFFFSNHFVFKLREKKNFKHFSEQKKLFSPNLYFEQRFQ